MSKVYLAGAGPGDPELLTLKARRVLERADSVLYDHLANPALLDYAPGAAERVYVGKKRSEHAFTQDEIVAMMIERARAGKTVVRLKGGDPLIFGRGGEELEGLAAAGIEYEVIPGVTAPLGIAAYTGVPLTHRDYASAVTFVTGHDVASTDWSKTTGTIVIFMGLMHLRDAAAGLIAAGRSPDTPAMAVRWATRPDQKLVEGTLGTLPGRCEEAGLKPPATVVIGDVVRLRERLDWYGRKPLLGVDVIVTRSRAQSGEFSARLRELGACPIELPVIELAPLEDYSALDRSIAQLEEYDWILLTSTNAVENFLARLHVCKRDVRAIRGKLCAIGPATREAIEAAHLMVDLVPEEHVSEGVAKAFAAFDLRGARVLLPRAAEAREVIPTTLTAMGAQVDLVDAYRNIVPGEAPGRIKEYLRRGRRAEWITFTSGSTVKNWLALAGRDSLDGVRVASIGPATSDVLRKYGVIVDAEANPHTTDALIEVIRR